MCRHEKHRLDELLTFCPGVRPHSELQLRTIVLGFFLGHNSTHKVDIQIFCGWSIISASKVMLKILQARLQQYVN